MTKKEVSAVLRSKLKDIRTCSGMEYFGNPDVDPEDFREVFLEPAFTDWLAESVRGYLSDGYSLDSVVPEATEALLAEMPLDVMLNEIAEHRNNFA